MAPEIEGVDYSFPPRPNAQLLKLAGKRFAVRYGGVGSASKWLDAGELRQLDQAGLAVVANVEGGEGGLLGGYDVGWDWAQRADQHFRKLGMPADRPIYLSVDFDADEGDWPKLREAFRGAGDAIGPHRVGIYAGYRPVVWARRDHSAEWFWQTYAWSNQHWAAGSQLQQYRNKVSLAGGTVDLCRALTPDYGQWRPGTGAAMQLDGIQATQLANTERMLGGLRDLSDPITRLGDGTVSVANPLAQTLRAIAGGMAALQAAVDALGEPRPVQLDAGELVAALKADPGALAAFTDAIGEAFAVAFWRQITEAIMADEARKSPSV